MSDSPTDRAAFIHRIGTRLTASFGALVLIVAALAAFGIHTLSAMQEQEARSEKLTTADRATLELSESKRQQRIYQAEFAVDADPDDVVLYDEENDKAAEYRDEVLANVSNPQVRGWVKEIDALDQEQQGLWKDQIIPQVQAGDAAGAQPKLVKAEELITEQIDLGTEITDFLGEKIGVQEAKVARDNHRLKNIFWIAGGLAVAVAVALAFLVTRSIVRPVRRLKVVSERIAAGEIDGLKVDTSGHDEIAELAVSLNNVAAAFEVMYATLGQPVSATNGTSEIRAETLGG